MKYCRQCGAQMKQEAMFCPKCGTQVQKNNNTQVWQNLTDQKAAPESKNVVNNEVMQNFVNKLPDGAKEQVKELTDKAAEGLTKFSDKAKEYGAKLTEKAGEFKENTEQAIQERKVTAQGHEKVEPTKEKKTGGWVLILSILVLVIVIIGAGSLYYLSRFTLVGVWKLVDTEKTSADIGSFDLTNPEELLEQSLLTLASGTRIVFTKEGDVFATASLGGATTSLGKMGYTQNGKESFTINASLDILVTTLTASYTCTYEFDGPDRLIVHIGEAELILTRDKEGDPEQYLENISELPFSFDLGGSSGEENADIEIPQSGEEVLDGMKDIGGKVGQALGDFLGGN